MFLLPNICCYYVFLFFYMRQCQVFDIWNWLLRLSIVCKDQKCSDFLNNSQREICQIYIYSKQIYCWTSFLCSHNLCKNAPNIRYSSILLIIQLDRIYQSIRSAEYSVWSNFKLFGLAEYQNIQPNWILQKSF